MYPGSPTRRPAPTATPTASVYHAPLKVAVRPKAALAILGLNPLTLGSHPLEDVRRHVLLHSLHPAAKKVLATLDREWDGLVRHRDFPDLALDNNPAERALRNPFVGRKNHHGAHAEWAAHLAARVWTLTATAERNGHEPLASLTDYLDACAEAGGRPPDGTALERFFVWLPAPGRPRRRRRPARSPPRRRASALTRSADPDPRPTGNAGRGPRRARPRDRRASTI